MASRSNIKDPLLLLVTAVCAALLVPALFMDGMFADGTQYAAVSRNFANGTASFWAPVFSATHYPVFTEQPPLMFAVQGLFFQLFGSSLYVERVYCLLSAIITTLLLLRTWKLLTQEKKTSWLPLLTWFTMPVIFYAYTNNIEECTMTIFVLLAFNAILRALEIAPGKNYLWYVAGGWLLAAGLTKGVQGMFLLSAPFWCWVILKNGGVKEFILRTIRMCVAPLIFVAVALNTPTIYNGLSGYFVSRFSKTFSGATAHSDNHFHLLFELLLDTLPAIGLLLILIIGGRKTPGFAAHARSSKRTIIFLLACAFSGILPLLITREQRGFYLATPLPLIALAFALAVQPVAARISDYISNRIALRNGVAVFGGLALTGVVVFTFLNAGKPRRDADKIAAVHEIASITGDNAVFVTSTAIDSDWNTLTYGQRYHGFSFTDQDTMHRDWYLLEKDSAVPFDYTLVKLQTPLFDLYRSNQFGKVRHGDGLNH